MSISTAPPQKKRNALFTALILFLAHVVLAITLFIAGNQLNILEMQQAAMATSIHALIFGASAIIIRSGRISLGGWIMIFTLAIGVPAVSLFVAGIGWVCLVAIPLLIAWVGSQTLSRDKIAWAILVGVISGVAAFLIDMFGSMDRLSLPLSNFLVPTIVFTLIFIAIFFLVRQFQTFTLQTKVLILFLAVSIIPLGILAILNSQLTRNTFTAAANQSLFSTGTQTANQIDTFIQNTTQSLQTEAQFSGLREYLTNVANGEFAFSTDATISMATMASKDPAHILTYALLDRDGGVRVTYPVTQTPQNVDVVDVLPPFLGVNYYVETGMRTTLTTGETYVSPVLFDENNQASIYFVTPVYDILDYTVPVGLLLLEYDAIILQNLIENQNGLAGVDSFGILFDENQLQLAHGTDPSTLYKTVSPLPMEEFENLVAVGRLPNVPYEEHSTGLPELSGKLSTAYEEPFFTATDVATGDRVNHVAVVTMKTKLWKVGFFQPQDVYLSVSNQQTRNTLLLVIGVATVVAFLSIGATRVLSSPISTLTELVEHIAAGNLTLQVPVITKDEIGRLAIAFNAMTAQIRNLLGGLELQVSERTRELERRAVQLQTAAQVARDASSMQELDQLLNRTVNLIEGRFGFYHAGIFLLDERKEYAVLRSANSEGGQEMLRRGHKLKVGQTGIVGFVTQTGEPRIALDVGTDSAHFAHALLPETRSEIALPLIVGEQIIGALDVQSKDSNAFDEGDITVLQVLADQLAIAIENTRLLSEVRQTVYQLQTAYGEFTQEAWSRWAQQTDQPTGYRYRGADIESTTEQSPETILAMKQGQVITKVAQNQLEPESTLAIPIRLRDQTLGAINLRIEGDEVSPEMIMLAENISNRLAVTLESARLYEETQRRAAQEQLTSEIASRIRESLDIDAVLKTAVQEIGLKLNLHDVSIQIDLNGNSTPERES